VLNLTANIRGNMITSQAEGFHGDGVPSVPLNGYGEFDLVPKLFFDGAGIHGFENGLVVFFREVTVDVEHHIDRFDEPGGLVSNNILGQSHVVRRDISGDAERFGIDSGAGNDGGHKQSKGFRRGFISTVFPGLVGFYIKGSGVYIDFFATRKECCVGFCCHVSPRVRSDS